MGDFSAEFLSSKNVETFLKNLIKFIEEQGMKNKLVELVNISKSFGSTKVLDELCLEVKENEFLTLLGPSGCGKTTTLRIIGGFERPDSGKVLFDGTDITNVPANKRNLNTVFQKYALFGHMTIEENIAFGLKIKNKSDAYIKDKIKYALKLVNLEGFEKRKPTSLSGGQQQRIAIARAIVNEPKVLLLDEPLGALDLKLRQNMQYELIRLKNELGITFIYVTHDQEEAFAMSDRVVVMNQGRIEQIGTPQEIYEEPSNLYVARFVGEINILPARIMSVPGEGIYIADISGRRFTLRTSRSFAAGDRVNVLLRPEDIRVYAHDDERPEGPYLTGRIEETVYKGATVDISIALDSGETLSVAEFFNEDDAEISYNRGERVAVTWVHGWEVV